MDILLGRMMYSTWAAQHFCEFLAGIFLLITGIVEDVHGAVPITFRLVVPSVQCNIFQILVFTFLEDSF